MNYLSKTCWTMMKIFRDSWKMLLPWEKFGRKSCLCIWNLWKRKCMYLWRAWRVTIELFIKYTYTWRYTLEICHDLLELSRQHAVELWQILRTVIPKFCGDAEKLHCSHNVLFQIFCCIKKMIEVLPCDKHFVSRNWESSLSNWNLLFFFWLVGKCRRMLFSLLDAMKTPINFFCRSTLSSVSSTPTSKPIFFFLQILQST